MFTDNTLVFSSYTSPVAITVTADSSIIDLTGAGAGNAPAMIGGRQNGVSYPIGLDVGAGDGAAMPSVTVIVGTTFAGSAGTTMSVAIKAAPATSATNNNPSTYTTLSTSDAIPIADLVAGAVVNLPIPPINMAELEAPPRFYKLTYTVASGTFSAGAVSAGIVMNQPNIGLYGNEVGQFPKNFSALP